MILVTGATGNVGRELVPLLLNAGEDVRAGSRRLEPRWPGAQAVHVDFEDQASLLAAAQGVDVTYLLTPISMTVSQIRSAVEALTDAGVQRVVFQSGLGAETNDDPESNLEIPIRESGLTWTLLRPNWFFQNYNQLFRRSVRDRSEFVEPAGPHLTSFIDARDIAAAALTVLTGSGHEGQGYALTGPEALNRFQVAEAISEALGRPITYRPVSEEAFVRSLVDAGDSDEAAARDFVSSYASIRADETAQVTDDLKRLTGSSGHTVAEFAQHYVQDWRPV